MRKTFAIVFDVLGAALILGFALALPYVIYIAVRYGVMDDRIAWVPFGMPGCFLGIAFLRIGTVIRG